MAESDDQTEAREPSQLPRKKPVGRPRLREDGGRREATGKRESFTNELKLDVVKRLRSTNKSRSTVKAFWPKLHPAAFPSLQKLIRKWEKKQAKLEKACSTSKGKLRARERPLGTGTALSKEAEEEIVLWVNDLRQEGVPVSALMLSLKADEVATSYSVKDFHASWCWQKHFKRRHNLSLRSRTRQGQQTAEHLAKVRQDFAAEVSATMDDLGVFTV
eukprot:jgi/Phyca11/126428/e_gw1.63.135.1